MNIKNAVLGCLLALVIGTAQSQEIHSATLGYYSGIDLETGNISPYDSFRPLDPAGDFYFGYHGRRDIHAVLLQNQSQMSQIAFLYGMPFSQVAYGDIATNLFTSSLVDAPFANGSSVLLLTAAGNYFKIGHAVEHTDSSNGVKFDYQLLTAPIPEPETYAMMLAGLGLLGVVARRRKKS